MPELKRVPAVRKDGLQLEEHTQFQIRFWRVERLAWALFALILLLSLAGLTGAGGPLAHAVAHTDAGSIEHPRVARWESADEMVIDFQPAPGTSTRALRLSTAFADHFQIESVQPEPRESLADGEGHLYRFDTGEGASARIVVHLRPQHPGLASYEVTLDAGAPVAFSTLILP